MNCHGLDTEKQVLFYENEFYPLSNFSSFCVDWVGYRFHTAEAAYHWSKFGGYYDIKLAIREATSAHEAMKIAHKNEAYVRKDWDYIKDAVMLDILRAKVAQHDYVLKKLLETGDRELVENSWRDDYWGWGENKDGKNNLGKLWMIVRDEIKALTPEK